MEIKIKLCCHDWIAAKELVREAVKMLDEIKGNRPDVVINVEAEVKEF